MQTATRATMKAAAKTAARSALRMPAQGLLRMAVRSAVVLPLLAAPGVPVAAAVPFGSTQWFSQAAAAQQPAATGRPPSGPIGAVPGRIVSPQEAQATAQKSIYNLTRATQAIMAAREAQGFAHTQALLGAQGLVPDGLGDDGLLPSDQAQDDLADPALCRASNSCVWQNATLPTQSSDRGRTTVTINQFDKKAILTWDSFSVGANTLLRFDQSLGTQADGNNDWVALNRVTAGSSPSTLLGQIRADGSIYLINHNGVIFGGSSQVDAHSLLVSSLPLYLSSGATALLPDDDPDYLAFSNDLFLNSGLTAVGSDAAAGNILGLNSGQNAPLAANLALPGDIALEQGAMLNVSKLGFALFAAPNVNNAGSIRATDGQVILAAGLGVALRNAASGSLLLQPVVSGRINDVENANADATPVGKVTNSGLIEAVRGDVRLLGSAIEQSGVVAATSSISRPGTLVLSAIDEQAVDSARARTGPLLMTAGSVTTVLPDGNGETTISSASATEDFRPGSISLTGAAVTLQGNGIDANNNAVAGALIEAPGQHVSISAVAQNDNSIAPRAIADDAVAGRLYLGEGATVDVAGIADNQLDMAIKFITVPRLGLNELADSPLQRDGILFASSVVIDSRVTGTRADGVQWVGTPVANLSGYVQQVTRDIRQMLRNGGNIDLAGGEVIQRQGSLLNLDAGFSHFINNGALPQTTRLVTDNGVTVDIGQANPDEHYVGFAGKTTEAHSRWNITTVASDPLGRGTRNNETDFIEGGNAGRLSVYAATATVLDGEISANTVAGRHQVANATLPVGGTLYMGQGNGNALLNRVYPESPPVVATQSYLLVEAAQSLAGILALGEAPPVEVPPAEIPPEEGTSPVEVVPVPVAFTEETFTSGSALPDVDTLLGLGDRANWRHWTQVSAQKIRDAGFSVVNIVADDSRLLSMGGEIAVAAGTHLSVQPGGSITLSGSRISVDGALQATAGSIALTATGRTDQIGTTIFPYIDTSLAPVAGDITLGSGALLDARGEWVNDTGRDENQLTGGAFINGGSVSLRTLQAATVRAAPLIADTTGAVVMNADSRIDVSSGGRILPSGALAGGVLAPAGRGGSIALETYVPALVNFGDIGAPPIPLVDVPPHSGNLRLGGTFSGFGFSGGGTLSLRMPGLQIGGEANAAQPWNLVLPEAFFSQLGFDNVVLKSEYNALITNNTRLHLQQSSLLPDFNLLADVATGTDLRSVPGAVTIGLRDDYYRRPQNLSIYAGDYVNWITNRFGSPNYSAAGIDGAVTLGANASLVADPGAAVTLGSHAQVTVLGSIIAHGGSITLTGDTANGGYAQNPGLISTAYSTDAKSVWLGADSLLDASGVVLLDPLAAALSTTHGAGTPITTGRVLAGGTVTLTNDTGYVVGLNCTDVDPTCDTGHKATINVSGTHALLDVVTLELPSKNFFEKLDIGSDAGTIRLGAGNGLFFNGKLQAQAGNTNAQGGTLLVTPANGRIPTIDGSSGALQLEVFSHALQMPVADIELEEVVGKYDVLTQEIIATTPLLLGDDISNALFPYLTADWLEVDVTPGVLQFSTTVLGGSGLSTLRLGSDSLRNINRPVPVVFTDNTVLGMSRELSINASILTATPPQYAQVVRPPRPEPGDDPDDPEVFLWDTAINVDLSAPYVRLTGLRFGGNYETLPDDLRFGDTSSLNLTAGVAMDIGGHVRMDNWKSINLASRGDLRFITPSTFAYLGDPANSAQVIRSPGLLETTADLSLSAAQIYPATDEHFIIQVHPTYSSDITITLDEDGEEEESDPTEPVFVRGAVNFARYPTGTELQTPLSVGGSLVVDARRISQGGILRAPGGQIALGLGTSDMELNEAWDAQSLAWLTYTALDEAGDALLMQLPGVITLKTYINKGGERTEQIEYEERFDVPLIASESVTFVPGSETSVSFGDQVVPYGVTIDGANLRYNGSASSGARAAPSSPDITSAPGKQIVSMADVIDVQAGAVIDLSGGGTLQAQEWVAGTGGSRDLLAATITSYNGGNTGVQVPQYADGRALYAILPGYDLKLAPYDPELVQSPLLGKSVWLSGGDGLAPGMYTLLPARYATLPGAYRVVQDTRLSHFDLSRNEQLPDGTLRMAGHVVDTFNNKRDALESAFLVQSDAVWRQYSEYRLTDLNTYFSAPAHSDNADWLPHDAGQLAVFADTSLKLKGSFLTGAGAAGLGAELNIAAPAVQVLDDAGIALAGYLQLDAETLSSLGFSRLVLGGISVRTAGGAGEVAVDLLKPMARAVDISTTQTALTAGEIVALTQSSSDEDGNAGDGIRVQGGSRIIATGTTSAARVRPIQVGVVDDSDEVDNSTVGYNGGGALLLVSSAAEIAAISRDNLNEEDLAALRIGQNAQLTGNSVLLDSTGVMNIDPSVQFDTDALTLASGEVTFSSIPSLSAPGGGLMIGQQLFDSFSNIGTLSILSRGSIAFDGDANISTANALLLSASVLEIGEHQVTLTAPVLGLASETIPDDATEPDVGTGSLHIIADELRLGAGVLAISEVGQVDVRSNRQIIVTDTGVLNFGEANVALHTPLMQAETGADARILTTGALSVDQVGVAATANATAIASVALGGGIALEGGSLAVDTRLVAASGVIDLHSLGNITLGEQALLSTAGISRQAFDVVQNTPGGIVSIVTDAGNVAMAAGAVIDVSGGGTADNSSAAQGGAITISALQGAAALQGGLRGRGDINNGGASHGGGAFALISDGAINLDDLVDRLAAGGIQGAVDVAAAHGNLQLAAGHVLRARDISLAATGGNGSADVLDGNVVIDGTLDASGSKGGRVELYGRSNVSVNGMIDAHGMAADRRGGDILLRTDAGSVGAAAALNTTWGYQGITAAMSGAINLGTTAALNVSGGSAGGLSGGKVRIRAPLLDGGDVNVSLASGAVIRGAREVSLEAVAVWSTLDASVGSQHFDGIVDPAGFYDAGGGLLLNPDHAAFYTQTLRDFVQQPGFVFADRFGSVANFNARAGIALVNPGNSVNDGDISVLSDWNLGAGTLVYDEGYGDGLLALEYRTHGYWAPVLHLDAANDILLAASLSDGFFQRVNPLGNGSTDNSAAPVASDANPLPFATAGLAGYTRDANGNVAPVDSTSFDLRAGNDIRISGHQEAYSEPGIAEPDPGADPDDPAGPAFGSRLLVAPTMLRTGSGSISLRAGNDFVLEEEIAPGVIYTAGRIVAGTRPADADEPLVETSEGLPAFLDVGIAHSEAAGDISLIVGNDVLAIQSVLDSTGDITGISDSNLTQFWWPWMQRACVATDDGCGDAASESAINFGMFHQGLMSIGGNISVAAAGKVNDLSVSLPVTWMLVEDADENIDVQIFGGGDFSLSAGRGISSGSWYIGRGQGSIRTQGGIDFDIFEPLDEENFVPVGTQIALQDARMDVVARGNLSIEGIHNPAYLFRNFDSLGYTERSAVSLASVAGRVVVGNEARRPGEAYGTSVDIEGVMVRAYDYLLPATVSLASWSDRVLVASRGELYPSPQGQWSIIAQDDIVLFSRARENNTWLGMIDADATLLPSPLNPAGDNIQTSFIDNGAASNFDLHRPIALHLQDNQPVRIYSVEDSVINSNPFTFVEGFQIFSPKRADIRAAEDIINLTFAGQNLYTSDITTLSAGRDIINTPLLPGYNVPYIELGGPGVLAVSAGRNLGPLTSTNDAWQFGYLPRLKPAYPGIRTVANERNAWLPRTGADIAIGFGNGAGMAFDEFTARYVDPSVSVAESGPREGLRSSTNTPDYRINLMRFVQQYLNDQAQRNGAPQPAILTAGEAWNVFASLPEAQRRYFASRIFLNVLDRVGLDYNDNKSDFKGEYARGYQAINLMFPPLLGYTLNNAQGGTNGAEILQTTGIFDMRGSTVQTRHGGDVSILGPGGQLLVGSASSPPTIPASGASSGVGPSTQGILALEKGGIGIFTDSSVLLAQSRIFTQQGGDVLIWSSNGDINAGKGAKTNTEVPPAAYLCDPDHFCLVDAKSQVSGAGIAVLQTRPGATAGSANLVAPRGTVDAGDAGIRVAGRLNVAAFRVANADNIQVAGAVIGVPTGAVDTGALAAANAAGSAATKVAESVTASRKGETAGSVLDVQVADYGDADCEGGKKKSDRSADCGN